MSDTASYGDNVRALNIAPRPTAFSGPVILEERGVRTSFANADELLEHMLDGGSPMARRNRRQAAFAAQGAAMILAAEKAEEAREAEWNATPWAARLQFLIASHEQAPDWIIVFLAFLLIAWTKLAGLV